MSGGVDSSVAALVLKRQGFDVFGITIKVWQEECEKVQRENCCGPRAVADARRVCEVLDIPFYLLNYSREFKEDVIDYFCAEYRRGRTPNPCIVCNQKLKFGRLLARARELGAAKIASGHYASIEERYDGGVSKFSLRKGKDAKKDQSYFLFELAQDQLCDILFPVGGMDKAAVRGLAAGAGLPVHDKPDSVEICFIPGDDYKAFLSAQGIAMPSGKIVDTSGKVVGRHNGIHLYTVGQRKGIGVAAKKPYYVVRIDPRENTVVVGGNDDLLVKEFVVEMPHWIACGGPQTSLCVDAKIRYNAPAVPAVVHPAGKAKVRVVFEEPQRAVTPGQAAVFYQGEFVLGGGWIA